MKIKDKIMRLFKYENIDNIKILKEFKEHPPRKSKMLERQFFYFISGKLLALIVVDKDNYLRDGYTSYLIAKENNIKYVRVVRI